MIQKIEPAAAIRLLDAKKAQAVDVREPDEYAVGHIPGAKLLPLGEVMSRAAEVLPDKDAPWLVYCRTGRRSADAVQKLDALGYTNIYDLGGILSWPYETGRDFEGISNVTESGVARLCAGRQLFRWAKFSLRAKESQKMLSDFDAPWIHEKGLLAFPD